MVYVLPLGASNCAGVLILFCFLPILGDQRGKLALGWVKNYAYDLCIANPEND